MRRLLLSLALVAGVASPAGPAAAQVCPGPLCNSTTTTPTTTPTTQAPTTTQRPTTTAAPTTAPPATTPAPGTPGGPTTLPEGAPPTTAPPAPAAPAPTSPPSAEAQVAARTGDDSDGRLLPWAIAVSLIGTSAAVGMLAVQWVRTRGLGRPEPIRWPGWLSRRAPSAP